MASSPKSGGLKLRASPRLNTGLDGRLVRAIMAPEPAPPAVSNPARYPKAFLAFIALERFFWSQQEPYYGRITIFSESNRPLFAAKLSPWALWSSALHPVSPGRGRSPHVVEPAKHTRHLPVSLDFVRVLPSIPWCPRRPRSHPVRVGRADCPCGGRPLGKRCTTQVRT